MLCANHSRLLQRVAALEAFHEEDIMAEDERVSRRSALTNALIYAASTVTILAAYTRAAYAKMAQKSVSYRDTPKGELKCSNCGLFEPPAACKTVDGVISPNGWCSIYRKV